MHPTVQLGYTGIWEIPCTQILIKKKPATQAGLYSMYTLVISALSEFERTLAIAQSAIHPSSEEKLGPQL